MPNSNCAGCSPTSLNAHYVLQQIEGRLGLGLWSFIGGGIGLLALLGWLNAGAAGWMGKATADAVFLAMTIYGLWSFFVKKTHKTDKTVA